MIHVKNYRFLKFLNPSPRLFHLFNNNENIFSNSINVHILSGLIKKKKSIPIIKTIFTTSYRSSQSFAGNPRARIIFSPYTLVQFSIDMYKKKNIYSFRKFYNIRPIKVYADYNFLTSFPYGIVPPTSDGYQLYILFCDVQEKILPSYSDVTTCLYSLTVFFRAVLCQ